MKANAMSRRKAKPTELVHAGYRGLRVEDVAARAGVNKTTIYRRWPTKEDLVGAAFRSMTGDKLVAPDTGSLRGDLLAIARGMIASASTPEGQSLFRVAVADGPDSEIMAIIRAQVETDRKVWRAMFEVHEARGELAQGVDSVMLFDILVAYLHHKLLADRTNLGEAELERFIDLLLLGALHPDKRPAAAKRR
jgi:AcrR family transcriptional regulator